MKQKYQDFGIRAWQPEDRQAVADIARVVLAEYDMSFEPDASDRDVVQIETAYWETGGEFWVVEHGDRLVGSGGYHPCDRANTEGARAAELRKMFLLPEARGKGLGRYLLTALEQAAAKRGFTEMWLETAVRMNVAVELYRKNGYQRPENSDVHVTRCDLVYCKQLAQTDTTSNSKNME